MRLFRKSDKKEQVSTNEATNGQQSAMPLPPSEPAKSGESTMNRMEMERRIREEAKRLRVTDHLLSAPHLQRVQETLRLNQTKLTNVEENLLRTREQKDRLRRFKELQSELEVQRIHMQEINKQCACMVNDRNELERFETFENIQGRFQRLQILERQRQNQKRRSSTLASQQEQRQHELNDDQKRTAQCQDEANAAETNLRQGQTAIGNARNLEGCNSTFDLLQHMMRERLNRLTSRCTALDKDLQEQEAAIEQLKQSIEKKRTRLQSTEAHRRMANHGELMVELLNQLHDLQQRQAETEIKAKETGRRQRSENDILGRVFSEYQQLQAQIKTLEDELHVHRQNILGQDSYRLQERAMEQKRRRQMLGSAQALWHRISTLYGHIENKMVEINALRLHKEHTEENLRNLETELGLLRRSCREKEYTFTLSKSQNVIQLRADLREGVCCTVCGATHHPYHSDTMLEQNKLIGELKTEAELLQVELRNKEAELLEMRLDLAQTATAKKHAEDELITLRSLQNETVKEWSMYAGLDSTLHSCDSTTNAEARAAMLEHLVESSEQDMKKAQVELDTYNFHQTRINEITEQLSRHEQTRSELSTRMNELNTSCQVLAREVERQSAYKQELAERHGEIFERLSHFMTFPDWQRSHEGTIMQVQEITSEREMLNNELREQEARLESLQTARERLAVHLAELQGQRQELEEDISNCENRKKENEKELERLLDGSKTKQFADNLLNEYAACRQALERQRLAMERRMEEFLHTQGMAEELQETMAQTDAMVASERSALDIWIRQYNASHPPVQYAELEHFFEQERDWTTVRNGIRNIVREAELTQAKLDYLRSQMVALQAEGNIPDGDTTEALLALAKQEEVLEKRREEAMLQIASNKLTLQAHEKAEAQIKGEKMREPAVCDSF